MIKILYNKAAPLIQRQTITILHANGHKILRDPIKNMMLQHAPHIRIAREAGTFDEVLSTLIQVHPDIYLFDYIVPGGKVKDILPINFRFFINL